MAKKKKNEKLKKVLVALPMWLIDELDTEAAELQVSRNELIRRILVSGFEVGESIQQSSIMELLQTQMAKQMQLMLKENRV